MTCTLALHLILFAITTALFFTKTQYTVLGGAWAALSQICKAEETREVLEYAAMLKDSQVVKRLKLNTESSTLVVRASGVDSGEMEIVVSGEKSGNRSRRPFSEKWS